MKRILSAIILAAALFTGCQEEEVQTPLTVDFTVDPSSPVTGSETTFTVKVAGGKFPYTYQWDFGDGLSGSAYIEKVTYEEPGDKTVSITITDSNGQSVYTEKSITVADRNAVPQLAAPSPSVRNIGHNFVTVGWDPTTEENSDGTYGFEFLDSDGKVLNTVTSGNFASPYNTILSIGNLRPEASYSFRLRNISTDESAMLSSEWGLLEFKTKAKPTAAQDVILEENFDGLVWCSDVFYGGYGFRPSDSAQKSCLSLDTPADEFKSCGTSTGSYFATFTEDFRNTTGVLAGWEGSAVYGQLGIAKLGSSSAAGYITTPALSGIDGLKDIEVTFKVSPYYDWGSGSSDAAKIVVSAENAGNAENGSIDISGLEVLQWHTQAVIIRNATAQTQVKISAETASKCRFFLDEIAIKASANTAPSIVVTPEAGEFASEGGSLTFNVASNSSWTLTGTPDWLTVNMTSGTAGAYDVTFTAGKASEDRSATVTFATTSGNDDKSVTLTLSQKFQKPVLAAPVLKLVKKTHNAIIAGWEDVTGDYSDNTYEFELIAADGTVYHETETLRKKTFGAANYANSMAYGNLKPSTTHTWRMRAVSTDETLCSSSEWAELEITTEAVPTEAEGILLSESFHDFVWSADYLIGGYGFRPDDKSQKAALSLDEPVDELKDCGTTTGDYYATFTADFRTAVNFLPGWSGSKVYGQFGYPKFGNSSAAGWIQTCTLSEIEGTADVEVTFLISPYFSWSKGTADTGTVTVTAEGAGEVTSGGEIQLDGLEAKVWASKTVTINGATSETAIKFSNGGKNQRFFLDDIVVKLK